MKDIIKLVSVVGARPQFVKLAPVARFLDNEAVAGHQIVHTGQHYDAEMSATFFDQLEIPKPDLDLGVGSGGHGHQTAEMLRKLESHLEDDRPDALIVYGDTNSTLAATLAASKMHIPVAHIEAGLRSFNRKMPEEINRVVADHCSDRLYAPTPQAIANLQKENLIDRALQSGDVMLDAIEFNLELASSRSTALEDNGLSPKQFGLVTIHRPVNTTPEALSKILQGLQAIADHHIALLLPMHPRTRAVLQQIDFSPRGRLKITKPLPYLDLIALIDAAALVITDSGGVQKEAALLNSPCVTMRTETEWTETVEAGVNRLVGNDHAAILAAVSEVLSSKDCFDDDTRRELREIYGNGQAARVICRDLIDWAEANRQ